MLGQVNLKAPWHAKRHGRPRTSRRRLRRKPEAIEVSRAGLVPIAALEAVVAIVQAVEQDIQLAEDMVFKELEKGW